MTNMRLSQNQSNEAVCSCDSICQFLHKLVRRYGNTKNKDQDFCTKYNVALRISENREPLCCDKCIKLFRNKKTAINQVKEYEGPKANDEVNTLEIDDCLF